MTNAIKVDIPEIIDTILKKHYTETDIKVHWVSDAAGMEGDWVEVSIVGHPLPKNAASLGIWFRIKNGKICEYSSPPDEEINLADPCLDIWLQKQINRVTNWYWNTGEV